jgi:hypothetical protein
MELNLLVVYLPESIQVELVLLVLLDIVELVLGIVRLALAEVMAVRRLA